MPTVSPDRFPLGTAAPDFDLPNLNTPGPDRVTLADAADKPVLVVMFLCNHCPYVKHVADPIAAIEREYADRVALIGINSNDAKNYPDDAPETMAPAAAAWNWGFPYLHDEAQDVAKAFRAVCTPDVYVFGSGRTLLYRGQIDGTRPRSGEPSTGEDLRAAIDAALSGERLNNPMPSVGCGIKWVPGNEPGYLSS